MEIFRVVPSQARLCLRISSEGGPGDHPFPSGFREGPSAVGEAASPSFHPLGQAHRRSFFRELGERSFSAVPNGATNLGCSRSWRPLVGPDFLSVSALPSRVQNGSRAHFFRAIRSLLR